MRSARVELSVPYRAVVVPRGARVAREVVYRASLVVDVPVVARADLSVAASCTDIPARYTNDVPRCEYLGHDEADGLWLPMADYDDPDLVLRVETAMRRLAVGSEELEDGEPNPFALVGHRPISKMNFLRARSIDDVILREHVEDDRTASLASAAALASDLMFCDDGRVLRRSPGPFYGSFEGRTVDLVATRFSLPKGLQHPFGAARLAEAVECFAMMVPDRRPETRGTVEIHRPEQMPDLDALLTARLATPRYWAKMFRAAVEGEAVEHRVAAEAAIAAGARIRGLDPDFHASGSSDVDPSAAGFALPGARDLVDAVELSRAFAENHLFSAASPVSAAVLTSLRDLWSQTMEPQLTRWDVFERDRLPVAEAAPELEAPGFGAAP
jgi:hypothetical protein